MRYVSPRFEHLTGAIDIAAFERESRGLLAIGILAGILVLACTAAVFPSHAPISTPHAALIHPPIPLRLIEIPHTRITSATGEHDTGTRQVPVTSSTITPASPPVPDDVLSPEETTAPEPADAPAVEEPPATSILRSASEPLPFTPYIDGIAPEPETGPVSADTLRRLTWEDTFHGHPGIVPPESERQRWEATIPLTENSNLFLSEGIGTLFWDPLNPIEPEPEDERRRFDPSFLGLPMGRGMTFIVIPGAIGFSAAGLLPSIQHFMKRMKWKYDDSRAENNRREIEGAGFVAITDQDIRTLVLLWRHGRLNPDQLTKEERSFLAGAESRIAITNRAYLEDMARRGLAVSLQKSGDIVYRAAIERSELVDGFITAIRFTLSPDMNGADSLYADTRERLTEYLQMILSDEEALIAGEEPPVTPATGTEADMSGNQHTPFFTGADNDSLQSISD